MLRTMRLVASLSVNTQEHDRVSEQSHDPSEVKAVEEESAQAELMLFVGLGGFHPGADFFQEMLGQRGGLRQQCRPLEGLIHHSDRGSQYAAAAFQQRLRACGVTASMSRKANPYDNALAESFVATLKAECFANSVAPSKAAAKLMTFDYIESYSTTAAADTVPSTTSLPSTSKINSSPEPRQLNFNH